MLAPSQYFSTVLFQQEIGILTKQANHGNNDFTVYKMLSQVLFH